MKLILPLLFMAACALAGTETQISQAKPVLDVLTPGVVYSAATTTVWVYDTDPPPAWYGIDLHYTDVAGSSQRLWYVCFTDPATPREKNGKYATACVVSGLEIKGGAAVALRSDGK